MVGCIPDEAGFLAVGSQQLALGSAAAAQRVQRGLHGCPESALNAHDAQRALHRIK